jgi:hypothetical protein
MGYLTPQEDDQDEFLKSGPQFVGPPKPSIENGGIDVPIPPAPEERKPAAFDPSKYMVTQADLQKATDDKKKAGYLGMILSGLANQQSAGNIATGRSASVDTSGFTKTLQDQADQPVLQKQALLKTEMEKPHIEYMKQAIDPTSPLSQQTTKLHQAYLAAAKRTISDPQAAAALDQVASSLDGQSAYQQEQTIKNSGLEKMLSTLGIANQKNELTRAMMQQRKDMFQDRIDESNHQKVLGAIRNDKGLNQRLTQYQNLDNAMANFTNAEHPTVQQFNELQQAVRANLGIKGTSGVGEREETYIKGLGLNWDAFKQFLTMQPQDVQKDNGLLLHIQQLAKMEQKNIGRQYGTRLAAVAGGNNSLYERRPDLKANLDSMFSNQMAQFGGSSQGQSDVAAGGGGKEPGGDGVPGVSTSQAAPKPGSKRKVSQQEIQDYAKKHSMNPNEAGMWLRSQGYATD